MAKDSNFVKMNTPTGGISYTNKEFVQKYIDKGYSLGEDFDYKNYQAPSRVVDSGGGYEGDGGGGGGWFGGGASGGRGTSFGGGMDSYFSEMESAQLAKLKLAQEKRRQVLENQKGRVGVEYDKVIGDINQQKAEATPRYHQARNQADSMYFDNAKRLEEMLADEGTVRGGKNITANVGLMGQRLGAMNELNTIEQEFYNKADHNISNALMERTQRIGEIDDAIANLEAQGIDQESIIMSELRAERFKMEFEMEKFQAQYDLQKYGMDMDHQFRREDMDLRKYGMEKEYGYKDLDYGYKDREMNIKEEGFKSDQDYRQWQMGMQEKEYNRVLDNDAWNRSKDNPAVQHQMLQNAIMNIELDYLPQYKKLGIQQLQKEIAQIGKSSGGGSSNPYAAETARIKLENLLMGRDDKEIDKYQKQINNLNYGNPTPADKVKYIGNLGSSGKVNSGIVDQLLLVNGLPSDEKALKKIVNPPAPAKKDPWYNKLYPKNWGK